MRISNSSILRALVSIIQHNMPSNAAPRPLYYTYMIITNYYTLHDSSTGVTLLNESTTIHTDTAHATMLIVTTTANERRMAVNNDCVTHTSFYHIGLNYHWSIFFDTGCKVRDM